VSAMACIASSYTCVSFALSRACLAWFLWQAPAGAASGGTSGCWGESSRSLLGAGVQPMGVLPERLLKVPGGVAGRGGVVGPLGSGPLGVAARAAKRLVFLPDIV